MLHEIDTQLGGWVHTYVVESPGVALTCNICMERCCLVFVKQSPGLVIDGRLYGDMREMQMQQLG